MLLALVVLIPLAAHRDARRGFFEDDDLDALTWARLIPLRDLVLNIPSLRYPPEHARPTGYFYFDALYRHVRLNYPPYVVVLQLVCVLDVVLLWLLLRRIGLDPIPTAAGCLFFALHRALFDAWWKPMFIYDVLCVTFALASVLAYSRRRWVLSFLCFWLALRSKEFGVVVPAILLCYEMTLGQRNWKRALVFFVPAVIYGVYGLVFNQRGQRPDSPYVMHFTVADIWKTSVFYVSKLLRIRYAGFAFLLTPFAVRDRRIWFGVGTLLLGLSIYLVLPARLLEVYLYAAMAGAAVVVAVLAARWPAVALPLLLIWTAWQLVLIHKNADRTLAQAADRKAYVAAIQQVPDSPIYIYDKAPASLRPWGIEGALRLFHSSVAQVHQLQDSGLPTEGRIQLLQWDERTRQLRTSSFSPTPFTYVKIGDALAPWQLVDGWQKDGTIGEHAIARLYRPPGANGFEWAACADHAILHIFVAGQDLATLHLDGCQHGRSPVRPGPPGVIVIDLVSDAKNQVRVKGFGFSPVP